MAVGKNKNLSKGKGGKGGKKKIIDPFSKKEWYMVKAPSTFSKKDVGHTLVTKTIGTKIIIYGISRGAAPESHFRPFADETARLQDEEHAFRKIKLKVEDVQGRNCLTQFYGMDLTTDKLRSLIKKWQTTIEAFVDVKTTDGYVLRMFCIAFTARREGQIKRSSYAQSSQVRAIRKKMMDIMTREASSCDLKELVGKLIPEAIGNEIKKGCAGIYPLQNVFVRKVKQIRAPKFDSSKLMEVHGDYSHEDVGARMEQQPAAPKEEEAKPEGEAEA